MVDRIVGFICAALALVSITVPTGRPHIVIVKERWAPLTQWTCTASETRERVYACEHRVRSAKTVAIPIRRNTNR